jgi:hypothetical protein
VAAVVVGLLSLTAGASGGVVVETAGVVVAGALSFAGAETITVLVEVLVRPEWPVAT